MLLITLISRLIFNISAKYCKSRLKLLSEGQNPITIPIKGDIIQNVPNCCSVENILRVMSIDKSLALFETLAVGSSASEVLRSRLDLTRKQYYSRMSAFLKAGLVQRQSGSYSLSSFGKIVYDALVIIGEALENYWKLAAIDSVQHLPEIGRNKIIEILIENSQIRESLLRDDHHKVMENNDHNNKNGNNRGQGQVVAKKYASS
jgi:hypothetical protein